MQALSVFDHRHATSRPKVRLGHLPGGTAGEPRDDGQQLPGSVWAYDNTLPRGRPARRGPGYPAVGDLSGGDDALLVVYTAAIGQVTNSNDRPTEALARLSARYREPARRRPEEHRRLATLGRQRPCQRFHIRYPLYRPEIPWLDTGRSFRDKCCHRQTFLRA